MNTERESLLVLDTYQTFGKNTFWIFIASWFEIPVVFLIVAFAISILRRTSFIPSEFQKIVAWLSLGCLGLAIISGIIAFFVARFTYKNQGFCISPDALKIRKGVFTKQETAIPYRQIQNVEVERSFNQQLCGVSKVVVVTAGHDDTTTDQNESKAVLETIDKELATALQEELLKRAGIERVVNVSK